jgi:hypothetical protein
MIGGLRAAVAYFRVLFEYLPEKTEGMGKFRQENRHPRGMDPVTFRLRSNHQPTLRVCFEQVVE